MLFFAGSIEGTVIEVINKISSVFYGPILAAFILAILTKKTNALGANLGILLGVALNIYLWLYVPQVFWFWWNAMGCIVTLIVGYTASLLLPVKSKDALSIVKYPARKETILLLAYFICIVLIAINIKIIFS